MNQKPKRKALKKTYRYVAMLIKSFEVSGYLSTSVVDIPLLFKTLVRWSIFNHDCYGNHTLNSDQYEDILAGVSKISTLQILEDFDESNLLQMSIDANGALVYHLSINGHDLTDALKISTPKKELVSI